MADDLIRSQIVRVEFFVEVPVNCTKEQFLEWVCGELGYGGIGIDNPLVHQGVPEPISEPVLTETQGFLHSVVFRNDDGTKTVRRWIDEEPFRGRDPNDEIIERKKDSPSAPRGAR
ncbi:hypothetical protein [Hoeflea poritis]|uniref:Uncharacterized protein n=1 Tax=Hoeflea poritis TaxID=2993659 RepID=A0ABT4VMZ5_9HYPH|nr:hypothetical protein [Hoeflea poritis]MDA4845979.1 hypothetical protein [Hoeflea poritis]